MIFITFLCLQLLLMSANVFGGESSESENISVEDLKDLLCDEKNAEVSKIIVGCFDETIHPEFPSIIAQCYAGFNAEIGEKFNGQVWRDWNCEHTIDEIKSADKCSDEMAIAWKGQEFLNEAVGQFGECVESKLPNDKRKK